MKQTKEVTCRYGVSYKVTFSGSTGAVARSFELMTKCCCWVCHNHDCKEPRNEEVDDCYNVCTFWFKDVAPCKTEKL